MQKRGISEVVASILLVAVIAVASFLAVNTSTKQITENEKTVSEALSEKSMQIQELMGVINSKKTSGKITLEIINYGIKEIVLSNVLVDGEESGFVLKNGNVIITNNTIAQKEIFVLEIYVSGRSVQLITDTGNLINVEIK